MTYNPLIELLLRNLSYLFKVVCVKKVTEFAEFVEFAEWLSLRDSSSKKQISNIFILRPGFVRKLSQL